MNQDKSNAYIIGGAIIVAGLLIVFGIFATQGNSTGTPNGDTDAVGATAEIPVAEVTSDDHIVGSPNAEVALIEYSDTECPFCQQFHANVRGVIDNYDADEVAWVYRHFPLAQLHPKAVTEAHALECVAALGGNDAFWTFTNRLYEITPSNNQLDLSVLPDLAVEAGISRSEFTACQESDQYADLVQADYDEAVAAGGRGTPYSVIVADNGIDGDERQAILALFGTRTDAVTFSEDGNRIGIGGVLPGQMLSSIFDILLGEAEEAA